MTTAIRRVSPRLAVATSSGACAIATPNVTFSEVAYGASTVHVTTPDNDFDAEVAGSAIAAQNGVNGDDENSISGTITVTGIAYNFNEVMNMLKQDLKLHKSPEKYLVYIYDKSFTYDIVDIDAKNKKIKITASIKGIEEFDIDPESENGQRLSKKIKEHVLGKSKKEASAYIQNLPEVNKVNIKTWPGWAPNLPSVPENIKIKVIQGEPVEEAAKELENSP